MIEEDKKTALAEEDKKTQTDKTVNLTPEEAVGTVPDINDSQKQWYVVNTYSGRERIVADYIEKRKISQHLENNIFRIVVAEQEEVVIDKKTNRAAVNKKGEVKKKTINLYPGYIFVEVIMSDLAWYVIRNTPGVTGLVGSSGAGTKPFPIPRDDMIPILKKMNLITPVVRADYEVGDKVRIIDGAFADETGDVASIDAANLQASITVTFFGRPTTVTVAFSSLEKE